MRLFYDGEDPDPATVFLGRGPEGEVSGMMHPGSYFAEGVVVDWAEAAEHLLVVQGNAASAGSDKYSALVRLKMGHIRGYGLSFASGPSQGENLQPWVCKTAGNQPHLYCHQCPVAPPD
jgi:hypothetical protein